MNCIRLKSLVNAASNEPRVGIQGASPTKWQVILSDEINIAIFRDNFFPSVFFINTPHFRMFSLRRRAACQISWISLKISLNPGSNEPEVSLNGLREGYLSYLYIFTILWIMFAIIRIFASFFYPFFSGHLYKLIRCCAGLSPLSLSLGSFQRGRKGLFTDTQPKSNGLNAAEICYFQDENVICKFFDL